MMQNNFCALILTHGRPDNVKTYDTLRRLGYTGPIYLVVDDGDQTIDRYRENFGDEQILVFSKQQIAKTFDEGRNSCDRRSVVYARNAGWGLARSCGHEYFIQLDDDYSDFVHKLDHRLDPTWGGDCTQRSILNLDAIFDAMVDFVKSTPMRTFAMSQGGDLMGGGAPKMRRKAMNSFVCSVDDEFRFLGYINEDVNTYCRLGNLGELFGSTMQLSLQQQQTQANSGGMTDIYQAAGTYVKSFLSVMWCPGFVKIGTISGNIGDKFLRIHHRINWRSAVPKIVREEVRK